MNLTLLKHPHPSLEKICPVYDFDTHAEDVETAKKMVDVMTDNYGHLIGVGVAAPQVGILRRFFVMFPDKQRRSEIIYAFDPRIIGHGRQIVSMPEGCLSVPGTSREMERWAVITVNYFDENKKFQERTLKYWEARVFQHEMDHLDGVLCMFKRGGLV